MHKVRDLLTQWLQVFVTKEGVAIDHRVFADGRNHFCDFFGEPVIILVTKGDEFPCGQGASLFEIAYKTQIALIDDDPDPLITRGKFPKDADGTVTAAVIDDDDLEGGVGLSQNRVELFF